MEIKNTVRRKTNSERRKENRNPAKEGQMMKGKEREKMERQ